MSGKFFSITEKNLSLRYNALTQNVQTAAAMLFPYNPKRLPFWVMAYTTTLYHNPSTGYDNGTSGKFFSITEKNLSLRYNAQP
jgi:hypothetical protein